MSINILWIKRRENKGQTGPNTSPLLQSYFAENLHGDPANIKYISYKLYKYDMYWFLIGLRNVKKTPEWMEGPTMSHLPPFARCVQKRRLKQS